MKYIKSYFLAILGLIALDQAVKIIIRCFFFSLENDILGNLIRFRPIINTNLSWSGNFISIFRNIIFINLINLLLIAIFISAYAYYRSKRPVSCILANIIYVTGMAGSICSLIDKIFWGGSLDFIQIPSLFTFDLKDCYISVAEVLFIFIFIKHANEISVMDYVKWCLKREK
jgi:signal peptidase II